MPKAVPAAKIVVADIHEFISDYKQQVFINALNSPSNIIINFDPEQGEPPFVSNVSVNIKFNETLLSEDNFILYPITIQGIGGDGKKRNCTAIVYFTPPKIYVDYIGIPKLNNGNYSEALKSFDAAIALNESYAEAWYYKGVAQNELGYEKYYLSDGHNETILKEANSATLDSLNRAIELNDTFEEARLGKASVLYRLNRYNESLNEYLHIIKENKSSLTAWANKGRILKEMGRYNESLFAYDQAFMLNQNYLDSWIFYSLGNDASAAKEYQTALQAYDKAIEIDKSDLNSWYKKVFMSYLLGKFNESVEVADKAIRDFKNESEYMYYDSIFINLMIVKSLSLDGLGKSNEADIAYETARNASSSPDSWIDISWLLYKSNRYNASLRLANTANDMEPENAYSWLLKSLALDSLGRHDEASKSFKKAKDTSGDIEWDYLAWELYKLGKYNESLTLANTAIEIDANSGNSWDTKGAALIGLGMYNEADESMDRAIEIEPRAIRFFHKAQALAGMNKNVEALEFYNMAIREEPDSSDGWYGKGEILRKLGRATEADEAFARAKELEDIGKKHYNGW